MDQKRRPLARLLSLHHSTSDRIQLTTTVKKKENAPELSVHPPVVATPMESPSSALTAVSQDQKQCKQGKKRPRQDSPSKKELPPSRCKAKHAGPTEMRLMRRAPPPLWKLNKAVPSGRIARDPRFDDLSGSLDMAAFTKNYQFLAEMRKNERVALKKAMSEAKNPEDRKKIKLAIQRIENQEREKKKAMEERRLKKIEKEALIASLKEGKRPYVKKKSEQKLELLCEKYKTLKKDNKLDKYLERKEKKKRAKELFK